MIFEKERDVASNEINKRDPLWWVRFWGAYTDVAEKLEWMNSVCTPEDSDEILEKWFLDSVKRLHSATERFIIEYSKREGS